MIAIPTQKWYRCVLKEDPACKGSMMITIKMEVKTMNAIDVLKERLSHNLKEFRIKWSEMSKEKLIDCAYEIYAVQKVCRELMRLVTEEDAELLLKYENPLDVVTEIYTMGDVDARAETMSEFESDYSRTIDKIRRLSETDIREIGFSITKAS